MSRNVVQTLFHIRFAIQEMCLLEVHVHLDQQHVLLDALHHLCGRHGFALELRHGSLETWIRAIGKVLERILKVIQAFVRAIVRLHRLLRMGGRRPTLGGRR